jgi:hypothetical protein
MTTRTPDSKKLRVIAEFPRAFRIDIPIVRRASYGLKTIQGKRACQSNPHSVAAANPRKDYRGGRHGRIGLRIQ